MKFPPTFIGQSKEINVIIETPKGSGNKYSFDPETGLYKLKKILPDGFVFPLHFGFIPNTKGEDGDPLDVLVLMDESSYPGCLIECRLIGVIEAEQKENGKLIRNDRLIASAIESPRYTALKSLKKLEKNLFKELVNFFVSYNKMEKKTFKPLSKRGPKTAIQLIEKNLTNGNNQ